MNKILITGGAGYAGSHCVKRFLEENHSVVIFDNLSKGFTEAIDILKAFGDLHFIEGDLRNKDDISKVFDKHSIDTVIHFAAAADVGDSMVDPGFYFENNVTGSINLLDTLQKHSVKKIIFSSTCAVYGETQYLPVDESHDTHPTSPYGESKLMIEKVIDWFKQIHDINYVILRYFNITGADKEGIIGYSKRPARHLMQNLVHAGLGLSEFKLTCPEVDTPDKTPIRDYIDIYDLIDAHYKAYEYLRDNQDSTVLNLGTGKGFSVMEIINEVENILNTEIDKSPGQKREGEYASIYANYDKALKVLNWKPQRTLEDSILSLKAFYEKHPQGYKY